MISVATGSLPTSVRSRGATLYMADVYVRATTLGTMCPRARSRIPHRSKSEQSGKRRAIPHRGATSWPTLEPLNYLSEPRSPKWEAKVWWLK